MLAVFVLALSLTGLISLTSTSFLTAKYANNEIVSNYLVQEAIDYIKNDRDTLVFQSSDPVAGWSNLLNKYQNCTSDGCYFEPFDGELATVNKCTGSVTGGFGTIKCPVFFYNENTTGDKSGFYTYKSLNGVTNSRFKRKVLVSTNPSNPDQLDIRVTVEWLNGNLPKSRSLYYSLLNW